MRVCQPGPVAIQRASVSGGSLRLIATLDSGDLGRPRGLSMVAAVRAPKILGRTSLAGRAFAIMTAVHSGFVRLVFLDFGCFFISFHYCLYVYTKSTPARYLRATFTVRSNVPSSATLRRRFALKSMAKSRTWKSVTHVPRRFCYLSLRPLSLENRQPHCFSPRRFFSS